MEVSGASSSAACDVVLLGEQNEALCKKKLEKFSCQCLSGSTNVLNSLAEENRFFCV